MCNDAKNEFISNNISDNKHNPKKFWDNLLKLWGKSKSKGRKISILQIHLPVKMLMTMMCLLCFMSFSVALPRKFNQTFLT